VCETPPSTSKEKLKTEESLDKLRINEILQVKSIYIIRKGSASIQIGI